MGTKVAETPEIADRLGAVAGDEPVGSLRLLARPLLRRLVYIGGDLFALVLAHTAAARLIHRLLQIPLASMNPAEYYQYYIPSFAIVLFLFDGYKGPELRRPERELESGCKAGALAFLGLVLFNFLVLKSQSFSLYLLVCWFVLAGLLLLIVRCTLRAVCQRLWKAGVGRRRTVLLGSPVGLARYAQLLSTQRHHARELLGWVPESPAATATPAGALCFPVLGSLDHWEEALDRAGADLLVVASSAWLNGDELLGRILRRCRELRLDVELYSSVLATSDLNYELDEFSGCFRFFARPQWSRRVQRAVKVFLDVLAGLLGSLLAALLTPVIGALINLEDSGPIFYRSAYVGPHGEDRYLLKFRSMRVDADRVLKENPELRQQFERQYKLTSDPRVTRVGRFLRKSSLDELPSFFNILRGDISLVGPRTIMREQQERYGLFLPRLLSVKPGLTGFWQVMGRQLTTHEERVEMDMFYIDHWSIWLDLLIIGKTFWTVLRAEGAY